MLKIHYLRKFERELEHAKKQGKKLKKLQDILNLLVEKNALPQKHHNHKLKGDFNNCWECHIEPDWLLIYKKTDTDLFLLRTGSHAALFK
ncbi:MAG: type II toxin-antitoxin system YafQ family toxin [Chlamydiota bacterium]